MAVGKQEAGTIVLRAYHEGGHIHIELRDDGAGLKTNRIRQKAVEKGVVTPEEAAAMTDAQVHRLIFAPGFSTAEKVTNLSGRGVGMDVVKTNIELIGGQLIWSPVKVKVRSLRSKFRLLWRLFLRLSLARKVSALRFRNCLLLSWSAPDRTMKTVLKT